MLRYARYRLLQTVPTLFLLSVGLFILVRVIPGDPAISILGENAEIAEVEALREQLGINGSVVQQYLIWSGNLLTGDLGNSLQLNRPVADLVAVRLPVTAMLASLAMLFTVVVAVPMGVIAATRRGRLADKAVLVTSLGGVAVPSFFVGMMLILIFAVKLGWLPSQGYQPLSAGLWSSLQGFILPAVTLGLLYAAIIARMTRASMLEVLSQDYILTAEAAGFSRTWVRYRYALRNAFIPVITVLGLNLGSLLGGSIITERVFSLPGLGTLLLSSIERRDYPMIQAIVLLVSLTYIVINVIVDIVYSAVDPRVRYAGA